MFLPLFSALVFLFIPQINILLGFLSSFILFSFFGFQRLFSSPFANVLSLKPLVCLCLFSLYWKISFLFCMSFHIISSTNSKWFLRRVCTLKVFSKWFKVWLTIIIFLQENIKPDKPLIHTVSTQILYTSLLYDSMENTCIILKI